MLNRLAVVVEEVGRMLLEMRDANQTHGHWEGTQFKAEADLRAHALLSQKLGDIDPSIPVISEEDIASQGGERPDRYWLIDPIDGTASFAGGFPGFVTQAALIVDCRPVLAAICAPAFGQLYLAEHGGGASLNGQRLAPLRLPQRRLLIDNYPQPRGTALTVFAALDCTGYVECGSIALKICRVADGTADLFFKDVAIRDWDIAAPDLVITEAGGILRLIDGEVPGYSGAWEHGGLIAAADPSLVQAFLGWREGTSA